ncbi:hypothetical protein [Actinomarinicola tropica]|uniref:Uncharacterized protein n=1 Tax=Actinomarinicola tropica TaxID=2789776 RepID=A0A5Q2RH87_9ACTN|nr:hypothetical protein [Actinomarinicola tropica]QGG96198.1 hypothetical protein GH723_14410 [Actinomarinicola tropica]
MGTTPRTPTPDGAPEPEPTLAAELGALLGDAGAAEEVLAGLREAAVEPVAEDVAARHLAAMFAAAGPGDVDLTGGPDAAGDDPDGGAVIDLTARRSKRAAVGGVIAIAALSLTGGLAAAGTLPAPLQNTVARVADAFSIPVPTADERDHVDVDDAPPTSTSADDTSTTTRPGQSGDTPGATAPGRTGETPGQSGDTPGATAPGRTGDTPGQSGETPGQSGDTPGQSGNPPGQSGDAPGQSGEAPGQSGSTPGATAPGQTGGPPPGQSGSTPGATAPGQGTPPNPPTGPDERPGSGASGGNQGTNGQGNGNQSGGNGQGNGNQGNGNQGNGNQGNGNGNPGRP